jgi:hypothetical protein
MVIDLFSGRQGFSHPPTTRQRIRIGYENSLLWLAYNVFRLPRVIDQRVVDLTAGITASREAWLQWATTNDPDWNIIHASPPCLEEE